MISERDKSVVYSMCMAGMSIDTLIKSFPQFNVEDIKQVYSDYLKDQGKDVPEEISISINCS